MDDKQRIDDALIAFDEMGFEPTTLLPDYERARKAWKANLVAAIKEMETETEALKLTIKKLQAANVDLKRTNEAIQKQTAKILSPIPIFGVTGIWAAIPIGWFLADLFGIAHYIRHKAKAL